MSRHYGKTRKTHRHIWANSWRRREYIILMNSQELDSQLSEEKLFRRALEFADDEKSKNYKDVLI